MSKWHLLSADIAGNGFKVVMHFPVPDTLNNAGFSLRTALQEYRGGGEYQSVLVNPGTEQAELDAGALYEYVYRFNSNPQQTGAQKRAQLDADWVTEDARIGSEMSTILQMWGAVSDT